ncbi:Zinc finger CCCH domain-containing protein 12 [Hibiscus syriacus]|uniref:Zinc finger CCCH domain-containing protein 12 n=1 Tax=Hibiscus syriacus TaxID=106335 RepID=A0A6A2X2E5_HIBSY|nr:Zinc finger CCCH domain-containing protein 12 [Hibiscus syriacus]
MDYSRENVVHVIQTNGPDNWVPNSSDPSVWATEEDYRAWYGQEASTDTPSYSSYDQRQPESLPEQPPSKKSRNSQDLNSGSRSRAIGKMFFKTKLCCKFKAGTCPYISNCNFAHSAEELRRPPPNWQEIVAAHEEEKGVTSEPPREEFQIPCLVYSSSAGETQRSYKGRHCKKFYSEEGCPYGDTCTFLHDEQSKNRESVAISLGPGGYGGGSAGGGGGGGNGSNTKPTNWKTRICNKWELTGYCPFGNKCHFAHGAAELHRYRGGLTDAETKDSLVLHLPTQSKGEEECPQKLLPMLRLFPLFHFPMFITRRGHLSYSKGQDKELLRNGKVRIKSALYMVTGSMTFNKLTPFKHRETK